MRLAILSSVALLLNIHSDCGQVILSPRLASRDLQDKAALPIGVGGEGARLACRFANDNIDIGRHS